MSHKWPHVNTYIYGCIIIYPTPRFQSSPFLFQLCTGTTLFSTTLYRYNFVFNFAFSPTTLKPFSSQPTLSGPRVSCQGHVEWRSIRFLLSFLFSGALCSFQRRDIELYCNPPSFVPHLQASFVHKCKLVIDVWPLVGHVIGYIKWRWNM